MNRREFSFSALLAWLPWAKPAPSPERPWESIRLTLEAGESSVWNDLAAWESWVEQQASSSLPNCEDVLRGCDGVERIALYSICCRLADGRVTNDA